MQSSDHIWDQFEYETILPAPSQPKADAMNKYSIENKENFLDANLMPCRPKNDVRQSVENHFSKKKQLFVFSRLHSFNY